MKGVIFVKFLDMIEDEMGLALADAVAGSGASSTGGVYTAIGTYDSAELQHMIAALSEATGQPTPALLRRFGAYMVEYFSAEYPHYFRDPGDLFSMLESVETRIHVDVRKLYDEARLPRFECHREADALRMIYRSARGLADLAEGMIEAAAGVYGERVTLERYDRTPENGLARTDFLIRRAAAAAPAA